jgi:hypothetical protein
MQILSAILNKYYSFTQPFGAMWTFWYIRESSTALITANIPFTWTLLRRAFNLHSFAGHSSHPNSHMPSNPRMRSGYGANTYNSSRGLQSHPHPRSFSLGNSCTHEPDIGPSESQERINKVDERSVPLRIYQKHEVEVTTKSVVDRDAEDDDEEETDGYAHAHAHVPAKLEPAVLAQHKQHVRTPSAEVENSSDRSTVGLVTTCRGVSSAN